MADKRVIEQTASTELYNDDWFLKDSVVEGTTKISAAKLKELLGADGTQALEEIANSIAEEYDSTHTYAYNSWVFHEGVLYRCIGNNVTGTWNATKWQAKTIKQFIADSENLITGRLLQMFGEYLPISTLDPPSIEAISKGDIFIYQRTNKYKFYRAKADHPQGVTEFDIDDWDEFDTVADLIEDVTENAGKVADVQVKTTGDYETVVENKIAKIDLSSMTAYGSVPNLPQAIVTFKDGADAPMPSLKVAIEPQQEGSGDPSPTNIRPISGWDEVNVTRTGKNIATTEIYKNNYVLASDGTENYASGFIITKSIKIDSSKSYYLSMIGEQSSSADAIRVGFYDKFLNFISRIEKSAPTPLTIPNNAEYIRLSYRIINPYFKDIQIEIGDEATSYEPYNGQTYTIDLDGTRYGGEVDVVSGVLTVDRAYVDLGTLNWALENGIFRLNESIGAKLTADTSAVANMLCSVYKTVSQNAMGSTTTDQCIAGLNWSNGVRVKDSNYTDVASFKTAMSGVQLVYELATPITYQLTPTQVKSLLGQNNVWADTGDINKCVYRRDMSSTIDDIIARLEALEG